MKTKYRMMIQHNMKLSGVGGYKNTTITLYHVGYPINIYLIKEQNWKDETWGADPDLETVNVSHDEIGDIEAANILNRIVNDICDRPKVE